MKELNSVLDTKIDYEEVLRAVNRGRQLRNEYMAEMLGNLFKALRPSPAKADDEFGRPQAV